MAKGRDDARPQQAGPSFEYRLNRTPVGVVMLDAELAIRSVNPVALRLLAPTGADLFGANILDLHPEEARDKVGWLISRASSGPEGTASLVVTTAMGSLVAKVSRLDGRGGAVEGYCMMIHALTDAPAMGRAESEAAEEQMEALAVAGEAGQALCPLMKLPLMRGKGAVISLIDVGEVVCLVAQGHYAEARTVSFSAFCPRSLADLERRLDPASFLRVHRRYVVNMRHVRGAARTDGAWHLILADKQGTQVPVSRAKVETMRRMLAV
ncbi:LytTR family transcriptional regulator DNA-binding domain-containing protein [Xanthobacter variabilis]|uniref:LytTR family transcriptional regulator DNA-binding domain-containing protein n=1 Tax=Xanthobacter variabilis TaxID=3119932 RepID=UPI00374F1F8F